MELLLISNPTFIAHEAEILSALFNAGLYRLHLRKPWTKLDAKSTSEIDIKTSIDTEAHTKANAEPQARLVADSETEHIEIIRDLLRQIPSKFYNRITIHDYFELQKEFGLGGIHLNAKHPNRPSDFALHSQPCLCSRACHSIQEVKESLGNVNECLRNKNNGFGSINENKNLGNENRIFSHFDYVLMSPIFDSISKQGYAAAYSAKALADAKAKGIINEKVVAMGGICQNNLADVKAMGFGGAAILGDIWQKYHDLNDLEKVIGHFKTLCNLVK